MAGEFLAGSNCMARRSKASAIIALPWRSLSCALRAEGETVIPNADCVEISYPAFFDDLEKLVER